MNACVSSFSLTLKENHLVVLSALGDPNTPTPNVQDGYNLQALPVGSPSARPGFQGKTSH